jgi:uncharacterized membrane protein
MSRLRGVSIDLSIIAAAFAVVVIAYPSLPEVIPTHWDAHGVANGFMPKSQGAYLLPLTMLGLYALLGVMPLFASRLRRSLTAYRSVVRVSLAFFLFLTCVTTYAGIGGKTPLNVTTLVVAAAGCLLAAIGNFLGKLQRNAIAGIRTPWTLKSDEVWERTHRVGGPTFVLTGVAVTVAALLGQAWLVAPLVLAEVLGLFAYSYVAYRRLEARPK